MMLFSQNTISIGIENRNYHLIKIPITLNTAMKIYPHSNEILLKNPQYNSTVNLAHYCPLIIDIFNRVFIIADQQSGIMTAFLDNTYELLSIIILSQN
ncbi:hypothetical protein C0W54_12050 [Photobacterium kishitanii]|nr:hypothetical protein C0W54_12050 [Photobacterium kishitanii]